MSTSDKLVRALPARWEALEWHPDHSPYDAAAECAEDLRRALDGKPPLEDKPGGDDA